MCVQTPSGEILSVCCGYRENAKMMFAVSLLSKDDCSHSLDVD